MRLPFSTEQFFSVFARYNEAVWPLQLVLYVLALIAIVLASRRVADPGRSRMVAGVLALLWLWMGVVYHLVFFRPINPAATAFGLAFVLEGGLLLRYGVHHTRLPFGASRDLRGAAGAVLAAYGLVGYPLLGAALGHRYPAAPIFGLPCPTTIVTLGLLLWVRGALPWMLLVIPLAWAAVGTSAALQLGVWEDLGLPAAALIVAAVAVGDRLTPRRPGASPRRARPVAREIAGPASPR